MAGESDPKRCFLTRLGGAIGGFIAGVPVGLEIGGRIADLFNHAFVPWGAMIGAGLFAVAGGIGGNWVAWGTSSACDIHGAPPGGPGLPSRNISKAKATRIWIIVIGAAALMILWPLQFRSFLSDIIVAAVWAVGAVWQYRAALEIRRNRSLRVAYA